MPIPIILLFSTPLFLMMFFANSQIISTPDISVPNFNAFVLVPVIFCSSLLNIATEKLFCSTSMPSI